MISKERYRELIEVCNNARPLYMQGAYTGISDELYDSYMADIRDYEKYHQAAPNSPTQSINPTIDGGDVTHPIAMLSLVDVFDKEDACAFLNKIRTNYDTDFTAEFKLDGLSVQLIYRGGKLVSASTRGDGHIGVECLSAAQYIRTIPKEIEANCDVVVRGEVYMTNSSFEDYCASYGKQANPRNTAVGIFKRKTEIDRASYLSFRAFNLENASDIPESEIPESIAKANPSLTHHTLCLALLDFWGFKLVEYYYISTSERLEQVLDGIYERREDLDIPIDGVVIKADSLALRRTLGDNGVTPHWAVAYKFPAKESETRLTGIEWNVGATGELTPVGLLDPVLVMGSTISRATLHNLQRVKDLDVQVGDMVVVYKAGDIIPAIKSARHTDESVPTEYPTTCPACGEALVDNRCVNIQCKEKLIARLMGWMDKKVGNFKGVGSSIVEALFSRGKLRTPADFYKIKPIEIMTLPGSGRAKMNTFMQRVNASKTEMAFSQVLVGLGINDLANAGAVKVEQAIRKEYSGKSYQIGLEVFRDLPLATLQTILGNAKGQSVYTQLQNPFIREIIGDISGVFSDRLL